MSRITTDQLAELHAQDKSGRITREMFQAFLDNPNKALDFLVTVDYSLSLADMIEVGKYDYKHEKISSKNFPIDGKGTADVKLKLVHLGRSAMTKEVEEHLTSLDLVPAKIEHLLAFGAKYPDMQREFPIAALGSGWVGPGGRRVLPFLSKDGFGRRLRLHWDGPGAEWRFDFRFLALT